MLYADESTCMVDLSKYFLQFTQNESCGKCVPCRLGTKRMLEILERITAGEGLPGDIEKLEKLALAVKRTSLCGLGQTAPNPVLTTIKYFRAEYEAHINEKRCPAHACKPLIAYMIVPEDCRGCAICARACPVNAAMGDKKQPHSIDPEICIKCDSCRAACRFSAVRVVTGDHAAQLLRAPRK
jgi:NADH-quinone oxidoreductase subunit F